MTATARFNSTLDAPYFSGRAVADTAEVPGFYDCALNGVSYLIDWTTDQLLRYQFRYKHETLPITRNQADNSAEPGEQSLARDGLWRRSSETWHAGAGQKYLDRPNSNPYRFHDSHGIDVWTPWQFKLLPQATQATSGSSPLGTALLAVAGGRLYAAFGQTLKWTTDLSTWTAVAGTHASTIVSLTSDGYHVYAVFANGINRVVGSTSVGTSAWCATTGTCVRYANGHLYLCAGSTLYEVDSTGTATSMGYTPLNVGWTMVDATAGHGVAYIAANMGDQGVVMRANLDLTVGATSLMVVAELPRGETVSAIKEYLGKLLIGTSRGWRLAEPTSANPGTGYFDVGALVQTPTPVLAFETDGQFAWYGVGHATEVESGTGRIDLTTINDGGVPAYSNDVTSEGVYSPTQAIVKYKGYLVWSLVASGGVNGVWSVPLFYDATTNPTPDTVVKRATGWIDSGFITYGLPDTKVLVSLDMRHEIMVDGDHSAWLSLDGAAFTALGQHGRDTMGTGTPGGATFAIPQSMADRVEVRHQLDRGTDTTVSVIITRSTLRASPQVDTVLQIQVPLILAREEDTGTGVRQRDTDQLYRDLLALRSSQIPVQYKERNTTYSVIVDDVILFPGAFELNGTVLAGTCVLRLKTVVF